MRMVKGSAYLLQFWEQEHLTVYHFILTEMFVSIQLPLIGILCYEILAKNCEQKGTGFLPAAEPAGQGVVHFLDFFFNKFLMLEVMTTY